jgi:5-methylcytosine-specific restriction endonuclease McrA
MKEPTGMHARLVALLRAHPDGLTEGEMRQQLALDPTEHSQLGRRRRDLRKWFQLHTKRIGRRFVYTLGQRREITATSGVNLRLKAEILHSARGQCQMCGRSIAKHKVALVVDHKIPQDWGGKSQPDNLWAICEDCNQGKKNLFSSKAQDVMANVMAHPSVHVRIGELLKLNFGKPVPSTLIEFVANQNDWRKRTRELRYLGWQIEAKREKAPGKRDSSAYTLRRFSEWPENPTAWIRDYEKQRALQGRTARPL